MWDMDSFGVNYPDFGYNEKYQYHVYKVVEGRCRV